MKTPRQKLADYLEIEGWELRTAQESELEWWADEIWELSSRWSPEGAKAYITVLVDPQHEGNRKKGQAVWAFGCSARYPRSRQEAESGGTISMGPGFKNEIEAFLSTLDKYRVAINEKRV